MKKNRNIEFKLGMALTILMVGLALFSLIYTPCDPNAINSIQKFRPPSPSHWLGTDNFGRDNFSRVITGARYSLFVAGSTILCSCSVGVLLGLFAGFTGGAADEIIMRLIDALASFPGVLTALVMVTVLNSGKYTIILALAVAFLPSYTRLIRSSTLRLKNCDFIDAARVCGIRKRRIMLRHILPNLLPTLVPAVVVGLSNAILAESSMSYLGLGIQPPTPSWGRMLFEGQSYLLRAPWETLSAGLMMMLTVLGFHYLGDSFQQQGR